MKFILTLITSCFLVATLLAQQTILQGKITDEETGEELIGANITLYQNGQVVNGTSTDFEGDYKLKTKPGVYELEVSYIGYSKRKMDRIDLNNDLKQDVKLPSGDVVDLEEIVVTNCWNVYPLHCGVAGINAVKPETVARTSKVTLSPGQKTNHPGSVHDIESKETLAGVNVSVFQNDEVIAGTSTDEKGRYSLELLPGSYELVFSYVGYEEYVRPLNVSAKVGEIGLSLVRMTKGVTLKEITITSDKPILIKHCIIACGGNVGGTHCFHWDVVEEEEASSRSEDSKVEIVEELALKLNCYPNPAISTLHVNLEQAVDHLVVFNLIGKKLLQMNKVEAGIVQLDLSNYVAGNYLIKMVKGKESLTKKFVLVKE